MPDYSTYSNDQLRRAVAERLGWTQISRDMDGLIRGLPPTEYERVALGRTLPPQWPESLDACWRDLTAFGYTLSNANHGDDELTVELRSARDAITDRYAAGDGIDENPARAWVIAWLRLMDQSGKSRPVIRDTSSMDCPFPDDSDL